MKAVQVKSLMVGVVAVASSVFLTACETEVRGGAILTPVVGDGEAILAVSSKIVDTESTTEIRSAGTFRNRLVGVGFSFRASDTDVLPAQAESVLPLLRSKFGATDAQCAGFVGEYRRNSGTDEQLPATGIVVAIVAQDETGTFVFMLAGSDGPAYAYLGAVKSGKLLAYGDYLDEAPDCDELLS